jgi:phage shock protein PspC (stress-responsive transcriptional regulator)
MQSARLERSNSNRVIGGVCGGLAEYLVVDATLVRVVFVVGTIMTAGLGILAYIVLLVLMPLPGRPAPFVSGGTGPPQATGAEGEPAVTAPAPETRDPAQVAAESERRRTVFGYVLIALGIAFFLGNAGAFRFVQWQLIWPLVIVGIGVLLLVQRVRS